MASFLYGRSSHREMKVPPPQPQSSERRPRKALRKGLFGLLAACVSVVLALMLVLFTPTGQRWAVNKALGIAASSMGADSSTVEVELSAVDVAWSPLGMSLNGLSIHRTEASGTRTPLASLSELVLLPADRTGMHWLTVSASGLDVSAEGSHWLTQGRSSTDTAAGSVPTSFSIADLDLSDVRLVLPDSLAPAPWAHEILVESAAVQGLTWDGGWPQWTGTSGQIKLFSRNLNSGQGDTSLIAWNGANDPVQVHLSTDPGFWLSPHSTDSDAIGACPGEWTATLAPLDSSLELLGTADWGTVRLLGGLDRQGLRLDMAKLSYARHPVALPDAVPSDGELALTGPISLPLNAGAGAELDWRNLLGRAAVTYRHKPARGAPCSASVEWDLETGDIACTGDWNVSQNETGSATQWGWSTQGRFVPLAALDPALSGNTADLGGTWTASRGGGAGAVSAEGTLELSAIPDGQRGMDVHWDLAARTAPLSITSGLDLYGGWGSSGELKLNDEGGIGSWWGHLDLNGARFIPLPGFDGRKRQGAPLSMNRFHVQGRGDQQGFEVDLDGDFIEGHIDGPNDLESWKLPVIDALVSGEIITKATAQRWGSSLTNSASTPPDWTANLTVWRDDLLERYSHDQWSIGSGSHVEVQHRSGEVSFMLDLRPLHWEDLKVHNLKVAGSGGTSPMAWQVHADSLRHTEWGLARDLVFSADVGLSSSSQFSASWDGTIPVDVALEHHIEGGNVHVVTPSTLGLRFADATWKLASGSVPRLQWEDADWTSLLVDDLRLSGRQGLLSIQSKEATFPSEIAVQLDRLPVAPWLGMLGPPLGMALPSGTGLLHAAFDVEFAPLSLSGAAQWEDAYLEGFDFGDLCLSGSWSDNPHIEFQQFQGEDQVLTAFMDGPDAAEVTLEAWPLELLQPLFVDAGVVLNGTATGGLSWELPERGAPPSADGTLAIHAPEVSIAATGMTYGLRGDLDFSEGFIGMDMGTITDPNGQTSLLNISVLHSGFTDWNYDLGLDLPEDFQVMDLAPDRSSLFYGKVVATGDANVFGTAESIAIQVDARSAKGTQFTMPLDAMEGPGIPSGIHFTGGNPSDLPETAPPPPFDLSMELEIEVTPDAALSLVLDQQAGERVDGRAQGALSLVSNREQSLSMEGGLEILEGQYRFSLRDLFTKTIAVAPGGRIDWDGNPYEAQLDLLAIATMKASPAPLLPGLLASAGKTDVEVGMGIAGELAGPTLDFSISFPTYAKADPELLAQVMPALGTPEETQRQAFALLAAGQFIPSDQVNTNALGRATAAAQATDLVSTGVSELLSSLSEDVDIGLRYLPSATGAVIDPTASVQDAFEMDLGLNLLNDRLKISGTLGARTPDGLQIDPSEITGAIDLRYQLTADGRWELMGYSKPESELEGADNYRYGLGAVYQVRFDHLRDLFRKSETP